MTWNDLGSMTWRQVLTNNLTCANSRWRISKLYVKTCPNSFHDDVSGHRARKLAGDRSISINDICRTLNISRSTYYRYLAMEPEGLSESSV